MYRTDIASEQEKIAPSVPSLVADRSRSGTVIECAVAARDGTLVTAYAWGKADDGLMPASGAVF